MPDTILLHKNKWHVYIRIFNGVIAGLTVVIIGIFLVIDFTKTRAVKRARAKVAMNSMTLASAGQVTTQDKGLQQEGKMSQIGSASDKPGMTSWSFIQRL